MSGSFEGKGVAPIAEDVTMILTRVMVAAGAAFGLDRLSKIAIVDWIGLPSAGVVDVWPPYLIFRMAWNKGINFGFFRSFDSRWALIAVAIAISLALVVWVRNERGWLRPLAVGSIVGGALGNAVDRILYGAVADFLNMSCCGIDNPSSFNVADIFIFGGVFALVVTARRASAAGSHAPGRSTRGGRPRCTRRDGRKRS